MHEPKAASAADVTAEAFWGARADEYNEYIRRVVPRYDEQIDRLFDYLPSHATRVLELGCGTGNVSLRLVTRWPDAHFTFVDAAPEMLELTAARVHAHAAASDARARFVESRFEELMLDAAAFDVIVASLSLHHVEDVATVYPRLAPALVSGGKLVMLDGIRGASDVEHGVHMARWAAFWQQTLAADEISEVVEHIRQHDHYRSLAEHFALLAQAGFMHADCVWRDGLFAVVTAYR